MGFYTALDVNGALGCTLLPVAATVDVDGWELSMWSCPPPTFSSQPFDITNACRGGEAVFHATTTGAPRWRHNGIVLSDIPGRIIGSGTSTLTIRSITVSDAGVYDCTSSGPCNAPYGSTFRASNPATLTLKTQDYNQDGNADQDDVNYLIDVVAGAPNLGGVDPDLNGDGNVDQSDIDALIDWVAGGPCP